MRKGLSILLVGLSILVSSCWQDAQTIWSVDVRSPDGLWIASGRTDQHGGPGTAGVQTAVYLTRVNSSDPKEAILVFFNGPPGSTSAITLQIHWLTPAHLEVTFSGHPNLDVQVVKYAGIEISVREDTSATNTAADSQSTSL
jgi:hypothetical protein